MLMWSGLGVDPSLVTTATAITKPVSPTAVLPGAQQQELKPSQITNGPLVDVGGFLFFPAGGSANFHVSVDGAGNYLGGDLSLQQWNFVKEQYQRVSDKQWNMQRYQMGVPSANFTTNYKGMHYNMALGPGMAGWYLPLVKGDQPIAKTHNPIMNKTYGLFVEYLGGPGDFRISFREIEKSWLSKIWDFLVNIVSTIVKFVSDIFDVFKSLACAMAQPAFQELSKIAIGTIPTAAVINQFAEIGIDRNQIAKVQKGATSSEVKGISSIVTAAYCKRATYKNITAWDPSLSSWRFAQPKTPAVTLAARKSGSFAEYQRKAGAATAKPTGITILTLPEYKRLITAWYARSSTWLIVGGVAAVGGLGYYALS